jgi:hypothetical protein
MTAAPSEKLDAKNEHYTAGGAAGQGGRRRDAGRSHPIGGNSECGMQKKKPQNVEVGSLGLWSSTVPTSSFCGSLLDILRFAFAKA